MLFLLVRSPFSGVKGDATATAQSYKTATRRPSESRCSANTSCNSRLSECFCQARSSARSCWPKPQAHRGEEAVDHDSACRLCGRQTVLFLTGLFGVLIRRNFIIVLMSVEIMLNAATINLVAFSHYLESMAGQIVALFIIAIAAGEAAIGLAIIIVVFRGKISTNVDEMNLLKW